MDYELNPPKHVIVGYFMYFSMNCTSNVSQMFHHRTTLHWKPTEVGWLCCSTDCPQWPHCSWGTGDAIHAVDFWRKIGPANLQSYGKEGGFWLGLLGRFERFFRSNFRSHVLSYKSAASLRPYWPGKTETLQQVTSLNRGGQIPQG